MLNKDAVSILGALYASYKEKFNEALKTYDSNIDELFEVVPSSAPAETYSFIEDLVSMNEIGRDTARLVSNYSQKEFSVTNTTFSTDFSVSRQEYKYNKGLKGMNKAKNVAKAAKKLYGKLVLKQLNGAFSTSTIFDGQPLISATHEINENTNIDNLITGGFSAGKLEEAITRLESFAIVPVNGEAEDIYPLSDNTDDLVIVCNPALRTTVEAVVNKQILASGESNLLYKRARVKTLSGIADTNAWYVINMGGVDIKPFIVQEDEAPNLRPLNDTDTAFKFRAESVVGCLSSVPWSIVGSQG